MNLIARIATTALALGALTGASMAQDITKIRIGTEGAYPPFNFVDANGELHGFDVDIANALCTEMKVECTFVAQDWDGIIPALLANKFDAIIASMTITEERQKRVDFTDKYYSTPPGLVAQKSTKLTATDPAALAGKTIGAQSATTHASFLEEQYTDSTIKLYASQNEANLDLLSGRLSAVMADSVVLVEWLKTEDGACCSMVGLVENDPKYFGEGVGIAVRKGEDELREKLNGAIAAIIANGTYEKISNEYFDFPVY